MTGHLETIIPALFRKINGVHYSRKRFTLNDGDFIDLDCVSTGSKSLILLLHGLEGNAQSQYILGCVKAFSSNGFDTISVNYRGCSGEPNLFLKSYHSGATADIYELLHKLKNDA